MSARSRAEVPASAARRDVLLVGNPNSGKSLLFNRLTGLQQRVANYPGVTVDVRSGQMGQARVRDFPGIYSLAPLTVDEQVAVRELEAGLADSATSAVVCVLDSTRLERSLYLLLQLLPRAQAAGVPVLAVANVMDEVLSRGARVDLDGLSAALGCPVLGISARTGLGLAELRARLERWCAQPREASAPRDPEATEAVGALKDRARALARAHGPSADVLLKSQHRLDAFFLSTVGGPIAFLVLMAVLFQAVFTWAAPLMDAVEWAVSALGELAAGLVPWQVGQDFVRDGLFGGVGGFLVFVPQIFVLFVVIGALEDSGYLARAAIILHRPLGWFGLSGKSFVPLLSGHACAIPAMMATRTIESPRRRLLTILAIPFMSCSARLPIYGLLIGAFIPARSVLGLFGLQGVVLTAVYALGVIAALVVSASLNAGLPRRAGRLADAPFVLELPPYRVPSALPILRSALSRSLSFVQRAAPVIFGVTVAVWVLGYFPRGAGHLEQSWLAYLGHLIEPALRPIGADWKVAVGVLTSFVAREVFVGTLGTLYGLETSGGQELSALLPIHGMGLATALALLVFYALSLQCASTLAVMRKETGSGRVVAAAFVGMTLIAYAGACLVYQLARHLG